MTETNDVMLEPDTPPANGEWVDTCDVLASATIEEVEQGRQLGEEIDPEDDDSGTMYRGIMGLTEKDSALAKARELKRVMLSYGVPQVSIELLPGRPNSYGDWDALHVVTEMSHHTVSRFGTNLTPCLWLIKNGRSDLPGPLSNGYGGWDLTYRIITFGYANHPGYGGPLTVPAFSGGTYTIPKDSARRYAWGTEWEGGVSASDWDRVLTNPRNGVRMTMREFMGRSNAALREYHRIVHHGEHSTWTSRKIDRLGYTARSGSDELLRYKNEGDWVDMADEATLRKIIREEVGSAQIVVDVKDKGPADDETKPLNWVLRQLLNDEERIKATVTANADRIKDAIIASIPPGAVAEGTMTITEVQAAVERGIRNVFGGLDETP